jgi:transposase
MRTGISLRADFDAEGLRRLARQSKHSAQARRLLALAAIYDGGSRSDAARLGNVTLQIVRDWVLRFNERGPEGLIDGKAPGPKSLLNDVQRAALAKAIERGADTLSRRCRALASVRSGPMAVGGVSCLGERTDAQPGGARHGLPQARCPPEASCAGHSSH